MTLRRKWRKWCKVIEEEMLDPFKYDKLVYEGYLEIIESNKEIQSPPDFHNWCCKNYGTSLLLCIRMLTDSDSRVYSIRKLVGNICENNKLITKYALLRCYPKHQHRTYKEFWDKQIGKEKKFLPKDIPLTHIDNIKILTRRANNITNKAVAHFDRKKRIRSFEFSSANEIIYRLVEILHFYSVLVGEEIACDINNYSIPYNWKEIFEKPWKK